MKKIYGLDFGASNSTVSLVNGSGEAVKLPIDEFGADKTVSPTILYYFKNECFCGAQADLLFKSTPVKERGRIMREIKTCATIAHLSGTQVDGRYKEFDEILADYLSFVKTKADQLVGEKVDQVVIGRPAAYIEEPDKERLAQHRIRSGAEKAGFDEVHFCYEPVAATVDRETFFEKGTVLLTFDFGGSTLDYHLLKINEANRPETLAHGGIAFGGNDITRLIFENKVLPRFGAGLEYELKETFQHHHLIKSKAEFRSVTSVLPRTLLKYDVTITERTIDEAIQLIRGVEWESHQKFPELDRLEACLKNNLIYPLFDAVESSKIRLSDQVKTLIEFNKESVVLSEELSRSEFENELSTRSEKVTRSLNELLARANVSREDVQGILTIGGSSKIPYYSQYLTSFFPQAKIYQGDLFGGVSKGLAKIGHHHESEYYVDM